MKVALHLLLGVAALAAARLPGQLRAPPYPIGINCGGQQFADTTTSPPTLYLADQPFGQDNLGIGYLTALATEVGEALPLGVGGTGLDPLYQQSRNSPARSSFGTPVEYRLLAPTDADYLVTIHTRDSWGHSDVLNLFTVELEGSAQMPPVAPHLPNRRDYASRRSYRVRVTDGALDVRLVPRATPGGFHEIAQICALRVDLLPAQGTPIPPSGVLARGTYGGVVVRWELQPDPRIHGYEVERNLDGNMSLVGGGLQHADRVIDDLSSFPLIDGDEISYRVRSYDVWGQRSAWSRSVYTCYTSPASSTVPFYEIAPASAADVVLQDYLASFLVNDNGTERPAAFRVLPDGQPFATLFRYRGKANMFTPKKSRKIKFNSGHPFGTTTRWRLNLNGEYWDSSLLHTLLSFQLFDLWRQPHCLVEPVNVAMRFPAPMPGWAHQGLHMSVENIDDEYVKRIAQAYGGRHPMTTNGRMYKADTLGQMVKLSSLSEYQTAFTVEVGSSGNKHRDIIDLIETVDDPSLSGDQKMEFLARNFDLDNLFTWLAINALVGNFDHTWHNYYLYRYPGNAPQQHRRGQWQIVPWDYDIAWLNGDDLINLPLRWGSFGEPATPPFSRNRLITILVGDDPSPTQAFRQLYYEKLEALRRDPIWTDAISRAQVFHSRIAREATLDPWKQGYDDSFHFRNGVADLTAFHSARSAFIASNVGALQPPVDQTDLRLNEFMVNNVAYLRDPDAVGTEFDPWIEIRNYSPIPRDVSGWSLTDDTSAPGKWVFPAGTEIPALGEIIVWADGQPSQGALHASFRLDNRSGGAIHLYRPGPALVDSRPYGASQPADTSLGRHPANGNWLTAPMALPTPAYLNWPGDQLPRLILNEVLSDNVANLLDDYDQADDWIEVYNAEAVPVSLAGVYLTNNASQPTLWQFPNAVIPPRTFVLVWADSQPQQARYFNRALGPSGTQTYHAGHSISKSGATLHLNARLFGDRLRTVQSLTVPALNTDQSYGRDPTDRYVVYATPTPGVPNP